MYGPMAPGAMGMHFMGMALMLLYLIVAGGGFALLAWAVLNLSERLVARRDRDLEELSRRYAGGELGEEEFQARRRELAAR
jgi:uncharacterized membrane protein